MKDFYLSFQDSILSTALDLIPVVLLVVFFQKIILKQSFPNLQKVIVGLVLVIIGLSMFMLGLDMALFPIGEMMATQLSAPEFVGNIGQTEVDWKSYYWIYIFAACIGFSTTVAEPSLIAVAIKAHQASGGTISKNGLRYTVALGVAFALTLGTFRIVTGTPLYIYILIGYLLVLIQTIFTPKQLVALAYDSGGVTTSTVTVPLVAALGLGLASTIPGRNPAVDGFGLIAFASLFPIISVLGYGQVIYFIKT
jgi:hypothetical protein